MKRFVDRLKKVDVFSKKTYGVLYSAVILCVAVIAVSQIGLRNTATRGYFTQIDTYEGAYFEVSAGIDSSEEYNITLDVEGDNLKDACILLNGESYSALTAGDNEIKVCEDSVVEVQIPNGTAVVRIKEFDEKLIFYTTAREIFADSGITLCCRVGIR